MIILQQPSMRRHGAVHTYALKVYSNDDGSGAKQIVGPFQSSDVNVAGILVTILQTSGSK